MHGLPNYGPDCADMAGIKRGKSSDASTFSAIVSTMKVTEALLVALIVIRSGNGSGPLVQEALTRVFAPWSQFAK